MGIATWLLSGVLAFALGRAIAVARPSYRSELLLVLIVAFAAGLTATALDFGGWAEPDWRAGLFAFLCAFGATGIFRLSRLVLSS